MISIVDKLNLNEAEGLTRYQGRIAILMSLMKLSDAKYQAREWSDHPYGYDGDLGHAVKFLIEGYDGVEPALDRHDVKALYACAIGSYLRNEEEADAMYHFARMLELLTEPLQRCKNKAYLDSPYLPKLREAAYNLLKIMLKNDAEDKELIEYMENYRREKGIVLPN